MNNVTEKINPKIESGWKEILAPEFEQEYFFALKNFLSVEKQNEIVYPPGPLIFNAFNMTPFDRVKVVIIGQDPYHGEGQAHGLCFSVPVGVRTPPSLVNIFKEISRESGCGIPTNGNLERWAAQGVLLLNATLTVRANQAGSHQGKGWEKFTDAVIQKLSEHKENLVFLLWGRYAQNKATLIDANKHHILKAPHPSPLSAHTGFLGCGHFAKTNIFLEGKGIEKINW
jgi:uracil-DNA glycosylase